MTNRIDGAAAKLSRLVATVTASAPNEQSLRHECEGALKSACIDLGIPWTPYQLDKALFMETGAVRFADVIHGAMIIEYEAPKSFRKRESSAQLNHARDQAREYTELVAAEEGRPLGEYELVVWDGESISFGKFKEGEPNWNRLSPFDETTARQLLLRLNDNATPLVSPSVLKACVGLESASGQELAPMLFKAISNSETRGVEGKDGGKTYLLFREWRRLFGQTVGINTERLEALIERQAETHGAAYSTNVPAYLFALHTYLALIAKLVAALALPSASQNILDGSSDLFQRIEALESAQLFEDAGVLNMLAGDFFSWTTDPSIWDDIHDGINRLVEKLRHISFDLSRKNPSSVRDLFKGMYEVFVPRELRHALGEVYTPDWLAAYVLDRINWKPSDDLLDPTCGTGTFVLEALKRRMIEWQHQMPSADSLMSGIFGVDLNPLAVLATKASIVVTLSGKLQPEKPIALPIYLADAINIAKPDKHGIYKHALQTELGPRQFAVPAKLVNSSGLFQSFQALRQLINADYDEKRIREAFLPSLDHLRLTDDEQQAVLTTISTLHDLHAHEWDGIWCAILADRFAAAGIPRVSHIIGNPPWVKWSHLPPEYAEFIKPMCQELNAFSQDRYVGGIESDISTIITMRAAINWLKPDGTLAFLITATLFSNESSQGFRRMESDDGTSIAGFQFVEDLKSIRHSKA